jgi:hypothetical protein
VSLARVRHAPTIEDEASEPAGSREGVLVGFVKGKSQRLQEPEGQARVLTA